MSQRARVKFGSMCRKVRLVILIFILVLLASIVVIGAGAGPQAIGQGNADVKVLVSGGELHGTNGLGFNKEGHLYVASVVGREIVILNPVTGEILNRLGPADGVQGPDDLTFDDDDTLYWTDLLSGEVGSRTSENVVVKQLVAPFVNPISINDEGRLFVAQAFTGDGLFELDPKLVDPPQKILGSGDPFNHLNGFDFGPDGWLYAPQQQQERMVRINVDTKAVEEVTDEIMGSCKFDSKGELHVEISDAVVHYDLDTDVITNIASLPEGTDNLAFNADDHLYTTNFKDGTVHQVFADGTTRLVIEGGLIAPGGVAVLPDGDAGESIFVADFWTVREYDGKTGELGIEGRDFFFDAPFSAAADGENLILTSWFGMTVEVWSPATHSIQEMYTANVPIDAIRFEDDLVVSELGSGSVVQLAAGTGVTTTLAAGLTVPSGLAATDDDLWVADWATGMVLQVVTDGVTEDPPKMIASGLAFPEGLAVEKDGSLLVVESGAGRLSRIDVDSGIVTTAAENLSLGAPGPAGWPPTWIFNGVAVGQDGTAYVTGDIDNVVYRIGFGPFYSHFPVIFGHE